MAESLLERLAALAASAATDISRSIYRAQWACAAARLGQIAVARAEIGSLRSKNAGYAPQLTAWILLAEGMVAHFEALSSSALDRFKRAHGLAVALSDAEIRSMAAAWMGASEFLLAKYEDAANHAVEAITHAPSNGALALARAHLVLATCLSASGALTLAQAQYTRARQYAVEASDISMQSVILYNVAAFHVSRISIDDALGDSVVEEIKLAELEVSSIGNLDHALGLGSLQAMVPLLRAQLCVIKGQWADAQALYAEFTTEATSHGLARHTPRFLAEHAQCQVMLNRREDALRLITEALEGLRGAVDADDRAACHGRLALSMKALGDRTASEQHQQEGLRSRTEFAEFQSTLRPAIVAATEQVLPR